MFNLPVRRWSVAIRIESALNYCVAKSSAPCHMIDNWHQRENAEKRAMGKTQKTLAVIILHTCVWYKNKTPNTFLSPFFSSSPRFAELTITSQTSSVWILIENSIKHPQTERTWIANTFIMVNKAIPVNGNHVVNGAVSDIAITSHGSSWYFVCWRVLPLPAWNVHMASLTAGMNRLLLLSCSSQHWP